MEPRTAPAYSARTSAETSDPLLNDARLRQVCGTLRDRFRIGHSTIRLEHGDEAHPCQQEPAAAV